jgi:hypothetical protein
MPTDSKHNTSNQEEIDLVYLFVKLGEFLKRAVLKLINFIGSVLVFLLRKWYYFAIAIILTVLSAFVLSEISDPFYHSHMTLRSNAIHNQPVMSNLDRLRGYATARNYSALSNELNLSIEDASVIKRIETFWYYDIGDDGIFDGIDTDRKFLSDTSIVKVDSVFSVRVEVYDSEILEKLEESLVQYLEANPFLEALNKQRLSNLGAQLNQIEYEIDKLDSLQKREYYTNPDELRQKEGQIVFTSEKVVRMYHSQMFHLLKLKQDCERDLNLYKDVVTVLEGFVEPVVPVNGTIQYAKKLIWYYVGLALLLAVIITFRKKIWIR